jgi:uncharacterized SAM-binding protein YcdF (DUF218 family)
MIDINRHMSKWKKPFRYMLVLLALAIGCSELADAIACNLATNPAPGKSCVVLVLGYPSNNDGTASQVQAMRVATGVQVYRQSHCDRLVFSGAAVKNHIVEAQTMAQLARQAGIPATAIEVETQARTTWENIKFSIPALAKSDQILIASDSLHAHRGRRYLCKQRPDLCDRTFVGVAYRPFVGVASPFLRNAARWRSLSCGETENRAWWKVGSSCYELFAWGRDLLMF